MMNLMNTAHRIRQLLFMLLFIALGSFTLVACGDDEQAECETSKVIERDAGDRDGDREEDELPGAPHDDEIDDEECSPPEDDEDDEDDEDGEDETDPDEAILAAWPDDAAAEEDEVIRLINIERAQGAVCRGTAMPAVAPLEANESLIRAARLHSHDMKTRDYFSHTNPDGEGPVERMRAQGFSGGTWGENIAMGQSSAAAAVQSWMSSQQGHCENIMNGSFNAVGIGYAAPYWTMKLGQAR